MSGEIHNISMEIGSLKQAVETMTSMWRQQESAAAEGRRALHDKFEALRSELSALVRRVDTMSVAINIIEPSVKGFNDDKLRNEGAKRLGLKLWSAMVVSGGVFGWGLHEFIGWLRH